MRFGGGFGGGGGGVGGSDSRIAGALCDTHAQGLGGPPFFSLERTRNVLDPPQQSKSSAKLSHHRAAIQINAKIVAVGRYRIGYTVFRGAGLSDYSVMLP